MTLEEFKIKFKELKAKGFVRSTRRGPTGIGHTFETEIGIDENNISLPDIPDFEIKAHRDGVTNMITLFTFNNKAWVMPPLDAIRKYGSYDQNGRLGMYYTMSLTPNSAGLFLNVDDDKITVQHTSGEIIATWQMDKLAERFIQKIPALLFVSARSEERDGREYFHFYRAQIMKGTTPELLADLFRAGDILVDLRLHDKVTMARNHGTGFRAYENKLPRLFNEIIDI